MAASFSARRAEQIYHLFNEVADLAPEASAERLDQACQNDPELRKEVESLLSADLRADAVLDAYEKPLLPTRSAVDVRRAGTDPLHLIGQKVAHYRVIAHLGGGGMGVVYKAEDTRLNRPVALKFLPPELTRDADARQRFVQEAQAASSLDHPNICTIYEIDETEEGRTFIAMAYYEGETLKAKIARGALPVEEALDYAIGIAEALSRAHDAGIVHRDVKPANVLVTDLGRVKLVDFGLAKVADVSLTKAGATLGTVSYMSPEQARGEAVDHRTDVWSLGVVLYEMLTGERPFRGENAEAVIYGIRHDAPMPLTSLRPEMPDRLQRIVAKALTRSLEDRYQRVEELVVDLRSLRGVPAQPAAGQTFAPFFRRRRVVLYGSVAALLLAGLVYLLARQTLGPASASSPIALEDRSAIAVMPLEDRSRNEEHGDFAEGMTDELTALLTRIEGLRVVPRQSVMHVNAPGQPLRELAQQLRVDYLVDGSVFWAGEQVRITVNLIDPTTETSLWGRSFVGAQRDVLALQQDVARAIVQEVRVQLTPEDEARLGKAREVDPRAYELYRLGGYSWGLPGEPLVTRIQKAIPYVERAIAIDSTFADAYAVLGTAYFGLGLYGVLSWEEAMPQAEWYLAKALELDETSAKAYQLKGHLLQVAKNWAGAEEALRQAIELNPGEADYYCHLGLLMIRTARLEEAKELATYALRLNPASLYAYVVNVMAHIFSRHYDEAIALSRKVIELHPDTWIGYFGLGHAYLGKGMNGEAVEILEKAVAADSSRIALLGYAYAVTGKREEAVKIVEALKAGPAEFRGDLGPIYISRIYTALGELEKALDWLQSVGPLQYTVDPAFDALRSEPRFQALLKTWGLDPQKHSNPEAIR